MLIGMMHFDYTAERLARIQVLLDDATRKKIAMKRPQPLLVRQLTASLDAMLKELRGSAVTVVPKSRTTYSRPSSIASFSNVAH